MLREVCDGVVCSTMLSRASVEGTLEAISRLLLESFVLALFVANKRMKLDDFGADSEEEADKSGGGEELENTPKILQIVRRCRHISVRSKVRIPKE